jgi:hypothetical protein
MHSMDAHSSKVAPTAQRFVELTDLVALREIGVEVVLTVEDASVRDFTAECESEAHAEINGSFVGYGKRPWQP